MEVQTPKIVLALDIGLKRIGVAKAIQNIALPLPPILRKNRNQAAKEISQLLLDSKANVLVVGIPMQKRDSALTDEDSLATMQKRIRHFVSLLTIPPHLEIIFLDESFSSFEALQKLEDKKSRKKAHSKDGSLDSLAALVILERYLINFDRIPQSNSKDENNDKQSTRN
ncbi:MULTISPECIES: Holliday junction resolvase RuvX [Helicobacter]|uniref:Putative pre-16S rRNA nuclease n=1 Tax=Helicobacter ganmani TaxID=60246 RepID=A0A3D8IF99_9HELI|nr:MULTISPECIES: Holliday junction resolvase RuvX [Helicobacter]RDU63394.1 Holliday junction resolvase RuvX [Helicobacter ganmani]